MDETDERTSLLIREMRRIHRSIFVLTLIVVMCTMAIVLALWSPDQEILLETLFILGAVLVACVFAVVIGLALGRTVENIKRG